MMWQVIIELVALVAVVSAVIIVLASFSTGGLDDVDTRGPRRRFPK